MHRATLNLPSRVDSIPATRRILTVLLLACRTVPEVVEQAALLVTEVATNAVRHGSGQVVVTVTDEGGRFPGWAENLPKSP
jgi:anti-sigma regulatory factor (Ser/Thr protein kinase)